jgi:hypothetical protein
MGMQVPYSVLTLGQPGFPEWPHCWSFVYTEDHVGALIPWRETNSRGVARKKPLCPMKFPLLRITFRHMDTTKRGDRGWKEAQRRWICAYLYCLNFVTRMCSEWNPHMVLVDSSLGVSVPNSACSYGKWRPWISWALGLPPGSFQIKFSTLFSARAQRCCPPPPPRALLTLSLPTTSNCAIMLSPA